MAPQMWDDAGLTYQKTNKNCRQPGPGIVAWHPLAVVQTGGGRPVFAPRTIPTGQIQPG